jgi:hypothetical protein
LIDCTASAAPANTQNAAKPKRMLFMRLTENWHFDPSKSQTPIAKRQKPENKKT